MLFEILTHVVVVRFNRGIALSKVHFESAVFTDAVDNQAVTIAPVQFITGVMQRYSNRFDILPVGVLNDYILTIWFRKHFIGLRLNLYDVILPYRTRYNKSFGTIR